MKHPFVAVALIGASLLAWHPAQAQKSAPESRIEKSKTAPAENQSSASKKQKVHENTRSGLDRLKQDVRKGKK